MPPAPSIAPEAVARAQRADQLLEQALDTQDPALLDDAVVLLRGTTAELPPGHPVRLNALWSLKAALQIRFGLHEVAADLDGAVTALRECLAGLPTDHPALPDTQLDLAYTLYGRFQETGHPTDLTEAVALYRAALPHVPLDDPQRPDHLAGYADVLLDLATRTDHPTVLDQAVEAGRAAVDAQPEVESRAAAFGVLALALRQRFLHRDDPTDLDHMVAAFRAAAAIDAPDGPERADRWANLGHALLDRLAHTGDAPDPDGAPEPDHPRPGPRPDPEADLDEAITALHRAVDGSPADDPERAERALRLGDALFDRFHDRADRADLDAAVDVLRGAIEVARRAGHPEPAAVGTVLTAVLIERYIRFGAAVDAEEARTVGREAVMTTPVGHPERLHRVASLGYVLQTHAERSGPPEALDDAVHLLRGALRDAREGQPGRDSVAFRLALALEARCAQAGDPADRAGATAAYREVCDTAPGGSPLHALATAALHRLGAPT